MFKKKSIKISHSCNLPRISFFERCVKEDVVAAVFSSTLRSTGSQFVS